MCKCDRMWHHVSLGTVRILVQYKADIIIIIPYNLFSLRKYWNFTNFTLDRLPHFLNITSRPGYLQLILSILQALTVNDRHNAIHNMNHSPIVSLKLTFIDIKESKKKKNRLHISRNSKDRHYNGKRKQDKRANNNLQNTTLKSKERTLRIPLKHGVHRNGKLFLLHTLNPSYFSCLRSGEGQMICDIFFIDIQFVKIYIIKKIVQCCLFFSMYKGGGISHTLESFTAIRTTSTISLCGIINGRTDIMWILFIYTSVSKDIRCWHIDISKMYIESVWINHMLSYWVLEVHITSIVGAVVVVIVW